MEKTHPAYLYAASMTYRNKSAPKYVKLQCKAFKAVANGKDGKYMVDAKRVELVDEMMKLMIMNKGIKRGLRLYDYVVV